MFAILMLLAAPVDPAIALHDDEADLRERGQASFIGERIEAEARTKGLEAVRIAATTTRSAWDHCTQKFADNASAVEVDPGSEVVKTALLACSTERGHAVWAWAMQIFLASSFKPSGSTSFRWSQDAYAKFAADQADSLLVRVSYNRQVAHLKRAREALEQRRREVLPRR